MTRRSMKFTNKRAIDHLREAVTDAGKICYYHDDCWGATATVALGTHEELTEICEGDADALIPDYKGPVPPNIDNKLMGLLLSRMEVHICTEISQ